MRRLSMLTALMGLAVLIAGCEDSTAPRDLIAPAAPRGFASTTGDHAVRLKWLANTESDLAGYRVYQAPCASGEACPYDLVAPTRDTEFTVSGLVNGQTRYFAVAAVDRAGNESDLSYENVFDTPRPEGFGQVLRDALIQPLDAGWIFSASTVVAFDDSSVDIYYARSGGVDRMVAPFVDTDIQDAGYASSLDVVDFAPTEGWAPSGSVELVAGHCYVVRTHDDHYAKIRVTRFSGSSLQMDWAYQIDPGNRELKAHPAIGIPRIRRVQQSAFGR